MESGTLSRKTCRRRLTAQSHTNIVSPYTNRKGLNVVNTVRKSILIMNALATNGNLGPQDVSRLLGLPKSSVHNILTTLESEQLVERNPDTGKFHLGVRLISLGHIAQQSLDVGRIARPLMGRLNQQTDETVHLTVLDDREVLYVDCIESTKRLRTYSVIGVRAELYCTSVGKAILAFQPPEYIREYLETVPRRKYTPNTLVDEGEILSELERVRHAGHAFDNMEHEEHLRCVGAPIRNAANEVFGSISVSGPEQRITSENLDELAEKTKAAAAEISLRLGYSRGE